MFRCHQVRLTWPAWSPGYNVVVSQWPPGEIKIKMGRSGYTALSLSSLHRSYNSHSGTNCNSRSFMYSPGAGGALVLQHCLSSQSREAANESFCYNYLVTDLCDKFSGLFIPDHERDTDRWSWLWWLYIPVLAVALSVSALSRMRRETTVNEVWPVSSGHWLALLETVDQFWAENLAVRGQRKCVMRDRDIVPGQALPAICHYYIVFNYQE